MATKYVSQTATNGYAIGSDGNNGTTKALAYLTLAAAISGATAGDTIIINDGVYTAATYHDVTKNLTINPENAGMVTLKATSGGGNVLYMRPSGCVLTLGDLIIDAEEKAGISCITSEITGARTLTLNGTRLRNPGSGAVGFKIGGIADNFTLNVNGASFYSLLSSGGIYLQANLGLVKIRGFYANNSDGVGSANSVYCPVFIDGRVANGVVMDVRGCSGTWKTQPAATSCAFIQTRGVRGVIAENKGVSLTGSANAASIIRYFNSNGIQADSIVIRNNKGSQLAAGGYLVMIGAEAVDANANKTNYAMIFGNDFQGSDGATTLHGIFIGASTGGVISGNTVRNAAIPAIAKLSSAVYIFDNDILYPKTGLTGSVRTKGATNVQIACNRIRMASGYQNPICCDQDPTLPTLSTGGTIIGNVLYSPVAMTYGAYIGGAADASSATLFLNDYVAPSFGSTVFQYGASTYSSAALWSAAYESTVKTSAAPIDSDIRFWKDAYSDMKISALSAVYPHLLPIF